MGITSLDMLRELRPRWHESGLRLVLTNGVFDLLHLGHVTYLEQARTLGDILVVGVNSDASTRAIKGPTRPLMPEEARTAVLAALRCVDYVTVFGEPTAEALVATLRPEIYVKGGDYTSTPGGTSVDESRLPEAHLVREYGGQVRLLPYRAGYSTSALLQRIGQLNNESEHK
jgi:rfaE bifunctional protein nucleotidyltransferase chain/domain